MGHAQGWGLQPLSLVALKKKNLFYCSMASMLAEAAGKDAEPTEGVTAA